jgi:hypothetical protein
VAELGPFPLEEPLRLFGGAVVASSSRPRAITVAGSPAGTGSARALADRLTGIVCTGAVIVIIRALVSAAQDEVRTKD